MNAISIDRLSNGILVSDRRQWMIGICRIALFAIAMLASAPLATADYSGAVLYGMSIPNGTSIVNVSSADGGQVVGFIIDSGNHFRAILWSGSSGGSAVDLTPSGFDASAAYGEAVREFGPRKGVRNSTSRNNDLRR